MNANTKTNQPITADKREMTEWYHQLSAEDTKKLSEIINEHRRREAEEAESA